MICPLGCQTFFMINTTEYEINYAHKCKNANNCWHFNIFSMINAISESLKATKDFIFQLISFYEWLKFHTQRS